MADTTATYALDNDHSASDAHHANLSALMDGPTRERILRLPIWPAAGKCLEIGAGGGSISRWVADQLTDGTVTALDLKPAPIGDHPRMRVVAHDLTSPQPLAEVIGTGFDLIVARMVLIHLPERERILHDLAALLAPGGALLVEDWVIHPGPGIVCAPSPEDEQLWERFRTAITGTFDRSGADRTWGLRTYQTMIQAGLTQVTTEIRADYWPGGHPGLRLTSTSTAQLAPKLLDAGLSQQELSRVHELARDPNMVIHGHFMYSTAGLRPA